MTNKHTEVPWKLHEHGVGDFVVYSEYNQDAVCVFDDPDEIYRFPDGYITNGQAEANARLIVTAVNYHHRLREALVLAVEFINKHPADPDITAEQRLRDELESDLKGILPFCEYNDKQVEELSKILFAQGYRKPE